MLESLDRDRFAKDKLQAWLYRIAYNTIIDDVRRQKRRPIQPLYDTISQSPELDTEFLIEKLLTRESVWLAVQQLTDDQKNVIILRFGEGLTAPKVAEILDKSEEAVRALQRRALINLKKILIQTQDGLE